MHFWEMLDKIIISNQTANPDVSIQIEKFANLILSKINWQDKHPCCLSFNCKLAE